MNFTYKGRRFPDYLKHGNACQFIAPVAKKFCRGVGIDVGAGRWPLDGALAHDRQHDGDALELPPGPFDFVFSSHCLEHLSDPISALEHWRSRLKPGGVLFLYLPHPAMEYWQPQNCRKHLHSWSPEAMVKIVGDLGFVDILHSERDMAWSFAVVAMKPGGSPEIG